MRYNIDNYITTYKDFIDKTKIGEIVITNDRLKIGHIRFDDNPFYYKIDSFRSKRDDKESLRLWIENVFKMNETPRRGKDALIKDIVENTFNPYFKVPIPENYEIFLGFNRNNTVYFNYNTGIVIPPLKSERFFKNSDIFFIGNDYKPITDIFNVNDVDTSLIEYILNKIMNKDDIQDMKKLVYNYIFKIDDVINISFKNQHHFEIIERVKCIFLQQINTYYPYNKFKKGFDINIENDIMKRVKNEMTLNNVVFNPNETLYDYIYSDYFRFKLFCYITKKRT